MTSLIHPSSSVSKSVKLGENVKVGPYCNIDGNISIGDGTELKSHVSITGNTSIGKNNVFYPFSNIGCDPQDLKFSGEESFLEIGNSNTFRENITISKGIAIRLRQKILTSGGRAIHLPNTPEVLINKIDRLSNIK